MSEQPAATIPVPEFGNGTGKATPAEFQTFLRSLLTQHLGDSCRRIPTTETSSWITIVNSLAEHFLATFPLPGIVPWNALKGKVEMTDITLDVVGRVFLRVDGIYSNSQDFIRKIAVRLLDLCRALDVWHEEDEEGGDINLTPLPLKQKAEDILVSILRDMASNAVVSSGQHIPGWRIFRDILLQWMSVCNGLMCNAFPATSSLILDPFGNPVIMEVKPQDPTNLEAADTPMNIIIANLEFIPCFISLVINVVVRSLSLPLKCQWLLSDLIYMALEISSKFLTYSLAEGSTTTNSLRCRSLIASLSATSRIGKHPVYSESWICMVESLLHIRLNFQTKLEWNAVDLAFCELLAGNPVPPSRMLIKEVSAKLGDGCNRQGEENLKPLLLCYLSNAIRNADPPILHELQCCIKDLDNYVELTELLGTRKSVLNLNNPPETHGGQLSISPDSWKTRVADVVRDLISPEPLSWMDEESDNASSIPLYIQRAVSEIQIGLRRGPANPSAPSRLAIMSRLIKLPCLLAHCDGTSCSQQNRLNTHIRLPSWISVLDSLLKGSKESITTDVHLAGYRALAAICKHCSADDDPQNSLDMFWRGLVDPDRSIRLAAGQALLNLMHNQTKNSSDKSQLITKVCNRLYLLLETSSDPRRETLLITVGSMGRTKCSELLCQVVCLLVAQLGRKNPVIKGFAYTQINTLSNYHGKTRYSIMLPYMDQIAPFAVQRMLSQPEIIAETCSLMNTTQEVFVSISLPRILPDLYANGEQKILDAIGKMLPTSNIARLFFAHSHTILAHIFLLPSQPLTNKGLNFVIQAVSTELKTSSIDIPSILKSCLVPLLAELVVVMGDVEGGGAQKGIDALKKVENILSTQKRGTTKVSDLGGFLKNYMLGLISNLNDMLQDIQGKKTLQMKQRILRSLGTLISLIGPPISNVSFQIMATFQTMATIPELAEVTFQTWHRFLVTLEPTDLGNHIGSTSAAIVTTWPSLPEPAKQLAIQIMDFIIAQTDDSVSPYLSEIVDLSSVDAFDELAVRLKERCGPYSPEQEFERLLSQCSTDNLTVATQALKELKSFLQNHATYIRQLTTDDIFSPLVGRLSATLITASTRDGEGTEIFRLLAFECLGILGALDPDRCQIPHRDTSMVVLRNYTDDAEAVIFAIHLIQDLLVSVFRSTSDTRYQSQLAYSIQELLKFCHFTPALVASGGGAPVPMKVRHRWNALPKHVLETVTPLLEGRYAINQVTFPETQHPIYPTQSTYREWIQLWAAHLIKRVSGPTAQRLFSVFRVTVRNKDVLVAHHLLPHMVLNILISGADDDALAIRREIITVLEDQVDIESKSTTDKKILSAQAVFMLLDHLNKWIRLVRQEISLKKPDNKRTRPDVGCNLEEQLIRLDSVLSNIDQNLMAQAAFQCKTFARSLMNFEQMILTTQQRGSGQGDLPGYYERLHEIYANLDEPDGMEGISTKIISPSLEHQIRQHESTGRWTSAQSCWEVRLQESPDNVDYHLGLLRCLRNLGHYDTLRTHVRGVLTRHPEWEHTLSSFQVEGAWMLGAWDDVKRLVERVSDQTPSIAIAKVLLAMLSEDPASIAQSLSHARSILGAPISAAGIKGYRRCYDALLDLHMIYDLELIHNATTRLSTGTQEALEQERRTQLLELSKTLEKRFSVTLPTFRSREPLLTMRRTAFALSPLDLSREIGKSWLASSKIARNTGQSQTAYSAVLQAQRCQAPFSFVESAKLVKETGGTLNALTQLENSIQLAGLTNNVIDMTRDSDPESDRMKAKVHVLRARWMTECDRFDNSTIYTIFSEAAVLQRTWEGAHYYLGSFHDDCFKSLSPTDQAGRGLKMNYQTVRAFSKAIMHGSKFIYQTVPRLLTIWLDSGQDANIVAKDSFKKMTESIARAIKEAPAYKWYTAFPQIVSRVGHENPEVYGHLMNLIKTVIQAYPKQALWLFMSVIKSTKIQRQRRGNDILQKLKSSRVNGLAKLIDASITMTNELLAMCDYQIESEKTYLNMSKTFPKLKRLGQSELIIPLQESMTASLPPANSMQPESQHSPFPLELPMFREFSDDIEVMKSLAKPRKITIHGSDGKTYIFLGKPKDDLRKDARLMDLFAIINKLLRGNSDSRRRQLHIRTYGVVALNEECGFIQWVPNTKPLRPIIVKYYEAMHLKTWSSELGNIFAAIKATEKEEDAALIFKEKVLSQYKPVFHEWFLETFPEPTAWLASRLCFGRTAAVMSMVGFILGLGDRHGENILMDTITGDAIHVDFNCLFEKGKTLETPERVPFRLTQNVIDGLGVTGVEGVFRIACEVTLQLLKTNRDSLMSVLDAFVHDPLVEWEDMKRKQDRQQQPSRRANLPAPNLNVAKAPVKQDLKEFALEALNPIERKLRGMYAGGKERHEREFSTSNMVQTLIHEATNPANLSKMYPGWAPWH